MWLMWGSEPWIGGDESQGPQRGGNPFCEAKSGRGNEWERAQWVGITQATVSRSSGSHWERWLSFPGYIWKAVFCLSKDKRPAGNLWVELNTTDRGVHRGQVTLYSFSLWATIHLNHPVYAKQLLFWDRTEHRADMGRMQITWPLLFTFCHNRFKPLCDCSSGTAWSRELNRTEQII